MLWVAKPRPPSLAALQQSGKSQIPLCSTPGVTVLVVGRGVIWLFAARGQGIWPALYLLQTSTCLRRPICVT